MTLSPTRFPRLHRNESPSLPRLEPAGWAELAAAFEGATGWRLAWEAQKPERKKAKSKAAKPARATLGIKAVRSRKASGSRATSAAGLPPAIARPSAMRLAQSIDRVLRELEEAQTTLWQQDAELATAIPVRAETDGSTKLALRIEAALQAAAEAIGCHAAAVYLLDEGTSELKLRAAWNLPKVRHTAPPRPLRGALADLEALAGHVVTIDNTAAMPQWRTPEPFPAACCVPLASPTQLLGTVWVFGRKHRDFSHEQTNVVELAAQRIAADLEREVLLREDRPRAIDIESVIEMPVVAPLVPTTPVPSAITAPLPQPVRREPARIVPASGTIARVTLPVSEPQPRALAPQIRRVPPVLDGWDFATPAPQVRTLAEAGWCDWAELSGGVLAVSLAEVAAPQIDVARGTVAAALTAHRSYPHDPPTLLEKLNETLCTSWSGSERAALVYGRLALASGRLELGMAGRPGALLLGSERRELLQLPSVQLGLDPDATFAPLFRTVAPGEVLLLLGEQALVDLNGLAPAKDLLAAALAKLEGATPERMAAALSELLIPARTRPSNPREFLLLRRRAG